MRQFDGVRPKSLAEIERLDLVAVGVVMGPVSSASSTAGTAPCGCHSTRSSTKETPFRLFPIASATDAVGPAGPRAATFELLVVVAAASNNVLTARATVRKRLEAIGALGARWLRRNGYRQRGQGVQLAMVGYGGSELGSFWSFTVAEDDETLRDLFNSLEDRVDPIGRP